MSLLNDYGPKTYGDLIARDYDRLYGRIGDAEATADLLAELAGEGPALELGIGTGRIALPLQARGVRVQGIDASQAMVAKLHEKPRGADIPVTHGNFAEFTLGEPFSLIYVVFNTIFALVSQEEQVSCFRSVARHLSPGGVFVLEAFVPDLKRFVRDQNVDVLDVEIDRVRLDVSRHDPATQRVVAQHVILSADGAKFYPVKLRYAWPAELDLMAQLANLRLRARWGGWRRESFTASSPLHVSVYEPA